MSFKALFRVVCLMCEGFVMTEVTCDVPFLLDRLHKLLRSAGNQHRRAALGITVHRTSALFLQPSQARF